MTFQNLEIIKPILDAIAEEGYETPSPIQAQALPIILSGRDLLASAQTGTGKTAAFAIPIIQSIHLNKEADKKGAIKALVLSPTRELAEQIKTSFKTYASKLNIKVGAIYGGASQRGQETMLNKGIDVLVATPGRLIDLINQRIVKLNEVQYFVLDEADTLLDMGFIKDVKHIKGFIPKTRQTMMFSATISKEVATLASELLNDPLQLELAPQELMIEKINHSVFFVDKSLKKELLLDLLTNRELESVLVFTRTKHGANKLVNYLLEYGLKVDAIHGNKSQAKRQIALNDFKEKRTRVLIATDIAARGIDIDDLTHVINFDLPESGETYVHRIGRTGRRGLNGEAITFCSKDERGLLKAVEKHTGLTLKVLQLEPVSEDSKFKKVVEGFTPQVDDVIDGKEVKKDRKPMKSKNKDLASNSPRDFGKQRGTSSSKKKMFQTKATDAFVEVEENDKKRRSTNYKKKNSAIGSNDPSIEEYKRRNSKEEFEYGNKDFQIKTRAPKREFKHRDSEAARKDNFRALTDRPNGSFGRKQGERREESEKSFTRPSSRPYTRKSEGESTGYQGKSTRPYNRKSEGESTGYQGKFTRPYTRKSEGESTGYQGKSTRPYTRKSEGESAGYQGKSPRPYARKRDDSRNVEFKGKPGSPNRPTRARTSGIVEVGEKELYGKKADRPYASRGEGRPSSRPYAKKASGGKSYDRKPAGRPQKSGFRGSRGQ